MQSFSRVSKAMEASHATALLDQKNKALKEMEEYVKAVSAGRGQATAACGGEDEEESEECCAAVMQHAASQFARAAILVVRHLLCFAALLSRSHSPTASTMRCSMSA